ncbi:hypothetical protein HDG37_006874 [Paraburkholderia sp. MM5384-R2]|nr:hypothetical protein [Paraburkholderia sp. MM5384-R2]
MRRHIVSMFLSLDGVAQSPDAPEEDASGDFRLGGWIVPYADEAVGASVPTVMR